MGNHPYLITLLVVKLLSQPAQAGKSSCETTSAVEGYSSTVTCHFDQNPFIHRQPIRILRYNFEKTSFTRTNLQPELMFKCDWEHSQPLPTCQTASPSITFIFNELEAGITFASTGQNHAGMYKCLPNGDVKSKSCDLHVRKPETSCNDVNVKEDEAAKITCNFNSDLRKTHDDFYVQWFPKDSHFETALSCNWQGPGDDDWICKARDPFTFNNENITETVTLGLKPGLKTLQGELLCNIVLYSEATVKAKRCTVVLGQTQTTKIATQSTPAPLTQASISFSATIVNYESSYALSISVNSRIVIVAFCILLLLIY